MNLNMAVCHKPLNASAGKVVHAETTVAHAVLNGSQYYHQDWSHAAAHVIVPPLRIDHNTPGYLMGLLAKYVIFQVFFFLEFFGIVLTVPSLPLTAIIDENLLCFSSDTLSVVASEHRPFSTKQRALGKEDFMKIPHGVAGVQDRMSVIWERGVVRVPALCTCDTSFMFFSFENQKINAPDQECQICMITHKALCNEPQTKNYLVS